MNSSTRPIFLHFLHPAPRVSWVPRPHVCFRGEDHRRRCWYQSSCRRAPWKIHLLNPTMEAWKDDLPFQLGDFQVKHVNFLGCGWSWKLQLRNFWVETLWAWLGTNDFFSVNWICNLMTNHDEPNQNISQKTLEYKSTFTHTSVHQGKNRWHSYHVLVCICQLLTYLLGTVSHVLWP